MSASPFCSEITNHSPSNSEHCTNDMLQRKGASNSFTDSNRRFNLSFMALMENLKKSLLRNSRVVHDNKAVAEVITKLDESIPDYCIQDCTRLSKLKRTDQF